MSEELHTITSDGRRRSHLEIILSQNQFSPEYIEEFHWHWTVAARRVREQIGDDIKLSKMLRHVFPKYTGGDRLLYRGENLGRWKSKSIGFCWTTSVDIARMFGRGLNAVKSGRRALSGASRDINNEQQA